MCWGCDGNTPPATSATRNCKSKYRQHQSQRPNILLSAFLSRNRQWQQQKRCERERRGGAGQSFREDGSYLIHAGRGRSGRDNCHRTRICRVIATGAAWQVETSEGYIGRARWERHCVGGRFSCGYCCGRSTEGCRRSAARIQFKLQHVRYAAAGCRSLHSDLGNSGRCTFGSSHLAGELACTNTLCS